MIDMFIKLINLNKNINIKNFYKLLKYISKIIYLFNKYLLYPILNLIYKDLLK